jgi:uncharacterized membrane protein YkvA (DUF1232 family)
MERSLPDNSMEDKLKTSIKQVFKHFGIIRRALVHPRVPWHAKGVAGCAVLYVISPIQIIPNLIPIIGQMDDVLVLALGIKYLRRYVPKSVFDECESNSRRPWIANVPIAPAHVRCDSCVSDLPVLPST